MTRFIHPAPGLSRVFGFIRVFMRARALFLLGTFWAGAADASSFVELKPVPGTASPSFVVLGAPPKIAPLPSQTLDPDVASGEVDRPPYHRPDPADSALVTLSPSVIALGEPDVPGRQVAVGKVDRAPSPGPDPSDSDIVTLSPSVIAMGEPAVVDEKVAAIDDKPHHLSSPMVIRGGVIGDAFSPEAPSAPAGGSQPSDAEASAAAHPDQPTKPSEPQPQPAAPPPAAPPRELQKPQ
jgi:hypothetical protein